MTDHFSLPYEAQQERAYRIPSPGGGAGGGVRADAGVEVTGLKDKVRWIQSRDSSPTARFRVSPQSANQHSLH